MIQDFPHLVKYFASKNPLHLLVFVLPLWLSLFYFSSFQTTNLVMAVIAFFMGVIYWSLIEYCIHRFLYHTHFESRLVNYFIGSFHQYHHENQSDHRILNAGFLMIYVLTPLILCPVFYFSQNLELTCNIGLGVLSGYYFYECIHFLLHFKVWEKGYLKYIQAYHFHHHDFQSSSNFGNTSSFWDLVFRTYSSDYKNYSMPPRTKECLIAENRARVIIHAEG